MPHEPLDAREDLTKERPRQVAFGKLQREVPSVPDQAPASLEQPLLEARERPIADGDGKNQPTPAAPRRWCPRTRPGGCRWIGETDRREGIGNCVRCGDH